LMSMPMMTSTQRPFSAAIPMTVSGTLSVIIFSRQISVLS
jgi:hypothetical protein